MTQNTKKTLTLYCCTKGRTVPSAPSIALGVMLLKAINTKFLQWGAGSRTSFQRKRAHIVPKPKRFQTGYEMIFQLRQSALNPPKTTSLSMSLQGNDIHCIPEWKMDSTHLGKIEVGEDASIKQKSTSSILFYRLDYRFEKERISLNC